MSGIVLEIDPTSEDAANVPLVLVDNTTYFLLAEDWPAPDVDMPTSSSISTEGEIPVTARHHNTTGTFTLRVVGATAAATQTAVNYIDKKLAKVMRDGGTLKRTTPSGATYVTDLLSGALAVVLDKRMITTNIAQVTVTLARKPYWRGTPVTLTSHSETTLPALVFTEGPFAPPNIAGLEIWCRPESLGANGAAVSAWTNEGSGAALAQGTGANQPTVATNVIDGQSAVLFDGSNDELDVAISADATRTVFIVAKQTIALDRYVLGFGAFGSNAIGDPGGGNAWGFTQTEAAGIASFGGTPTSWSAVGVRFNSTSSADGFVNGGALTSFDPNDSYSTATILKLGQQGNSARFWNGHVAEILVYNTALSDADRLAVLGYLSAKYPSLGSFGTAPASGGIQGDVPALGRLIITEGSAADQWWEIHGIQSRYYSSSVDAKLLYEAETRTPQGAATAVGPTGASGAGSNTVLANALTTSYQSILSTQAAGGGNHLAHVGDLQVYARVQVPTANAGTVSVALEWAVGDFLRVTRNDTVSLSGTGGTWRLVNLGQVSIPKVAQGTQRWEGRILAKSTSAGDDIYVDHLMLVPVTEGSGIVSGVQQTIAPTAFTASDTFDQASATFSGATMTQGGAWSSAGVATDFTIDTTNHYAKRTTTTEASPRFGIAGTTVFTNIVVQTDITASSSADRRGVILRYVDTSNYAAAYVENFTVVFVVVVAGVATTTTFNLLTSYASIRASADSAGRWTVAYATSSGGAFVQALSGQHAALATGGVLASGKAGLYDKSATTLGSTRTYDNFAAATFVTDAAVFASRQLEIRNDRVIRQDSAGAVWATPSSFEGDYLVIPCSGREGRTVRIIVKGCRNDPTTGADSAIDDISAQLVYTPRFMTLPE